MSEKVIVEVIEATKAFGQGRGEVLAVDRVSLSVPAGQLLLIMGPSGSGKTTLLTIMGGLLRPSSGSVIVDGVDITRLSEGQLAPIRREKVGFVFQTFNLWETLNVRENVELALNMAGSSGKGARARAERLLTERGLADRLEFRTRDLSGGEKQRVSVARALANEPSLLLADEPTANLDSKRGYEVMKLLHGISREKDRAVVVVSHDERIREVADRVMWMEDGRIEDIGGLAVDPVCRMSVEAVKAVTAEHNGNVYYFCSRGCSWEFGTDPGRFAGAADERRN
jgi:putative ABC transport system ATP-binding protein